MTDAGGDWVGVPMHGGGLRWDWVPADQPASPDGRPGAWHFVSGVAGHGGTWEFFPTYDGWWQQPEPLGRRARLATVFLGLATAAAVLAAVLDLVQVRLLTSYLDDPDAGLDGVGTRDSLSVLGGVVWLAAFVPAGVFLVRWLHLAYRNLDLVAPGFRRHGVGWSIGAWFVPFLNLWRPKQIVDDVDAGTAGGAHGLISLWWLVWVVGEFGGNVSSRLIFHADAIEEFRKADIADAVVSGFEALAGVLAILVVRAVTAAYGRRVAEGSQQDAPPVAPPGTRTA